MGVKEKIKSFYPIGNTAFYSFAGSGFAFAIILLFSMLVSIWNGEPIPTLCVVACGICIVIFVMSLIYIFTSWIYDYFKNRNDSTKENKVEGNTPDGTRVPALDNENADKTAETSSSEQEKTDNITEENDTNNNIVNDSNEIEEIKEDSEMQSNNLSSSETEEGMVGLQNDGDIVDNNEEEPEVVKEEDEQINGEGESNIDKKQNDFMQNFVIFEGEGRKYVYKIIKETLLASAKNKAADKYSAIILNAALEMKWICRVPKYNEAVDFFGKKIIDKESTYNRHRRGILGDYNQKVHSIKMLLKSKMQDVIESHDINTNKNADKLK